MESTIYFDSMEILKSILKVFGFIAILLLIIIPATTGTLLGIRFGAERHKEAVESSVGATGNRENTIDFRDAEREKIIAQREADKTKAELIREQRKADRQYYLMNFPWGDLILIILCVLFTICCIIYIIRN